MINVKSIGRHLGRGRHENGWVEKVGKRVKKWRGYYHIYELQVDGSEKRRRRKVLLGNCANINKGDAEDKLRDIIKVARGQRVVAGPEATVSALCEDYFRMRKGDWSEANQDTVHAVLELIKTPIGAMEVAEVEAVDLKGLVNSLPERRWKTPKGQTRVGISESYAKKTITYLRAIFDYALAQNLIEKNPARDPVVKLKLPKGVRKPTKGYLAFEDMLRLLAQLSAEGHLIIHVALVCLLRPNEILALRRNDVADGWLRIDEALDRKRNFKEPKTNESNGRVSIPSRLQRELKEWMQLHPGAADDLLFQNRDGRPKDRDKLLDRMLKPAAKRAGLGNVTFQMLRRTFSTLMQNTAGVKDIQAQMRHARPDTTATIYMQPIPAQQAKAVNSYEKLIFAETQGAIQ